MKMRKFLSVFKWFILIAALLLLLGPPILKHLNQNKDERKINALVENPVAIELEDLQALNDHFINTQAEDPFDEKGNLKVKTIEPTPSTKEPQSENGTKALEEALRNLDYVNAAVILPKIGMKIPVYYGTGYDVLAIGAGFIEGTSLPTGKKGEHAFIAAHRGTYYVKTFHDLGKFEVKDRFSLLLGNILFIYEVNKVEIIQPWKFNPNEQQPDKSLLTLYTCDPIPSFENRLLVTGELISIQQINPNTNLDSITLAK